MSTIGSELSELENLVNRLGSGNAQKRRTKKQKPIKSSRTRRSNFPNTGKPSWNIEEELSHLDRYDYDSPSKKRCLRLTSFRIVLSMMILVLLVGLFHLNVQPAVYISHPELENEDFSRSKPTINTPKSEKVENIKPLTLEHFAPSSIDGKKENLLLTSYFVHQRDPLGHKQMAFNQSLIDQFLLDVSKFLDDCHIVMFIDWKFEVDSSLPIEFVYVDFNGIEYSTNDYRWFLCYNYIAKHKKFKWILMADFKDVKYGRNPFKFFRGSSLKLFSGSENIESGRYLPWLKKKFQNCYRGQKTRENGRVKDILDLVEKDKSKYFYPDAGVFGGQRTYVRNVLKDMLLIFRDLPRRGEDDICNSNSLVYFAALYAFHEEKLVFTGPPFHSPHRKFLDVSSRYVIFHK